MCEVVIEGFDCWWGCDCESLSIGYAQIDPSDSQNFCSYCTKLQDGCITFLMLPKF